MTLRNTPVTDDERLSSDEVDKLRLWLTETGRQDERLDGAITLSDVAEACGLAVSDVAAQLRQIRAEKAFAKAPARPKSQVPLLILAVAMIGVAGVIVKMRPRGPLTEAEADQIISEAVNKPHRIHYPVDKTIDLGADTPPQGFELEVDGRYVLGSSRSSGNGKIMNADATLTQLVRSAEALVRAVQKIEQETPSPPSDYKILPPGGRPTDPKIGAQATANQNPGTDNSPLAENEYQIKQPRTWQGVLGRVSAPPNDSIALAAWRQKLTDQMRVLVQSTTQLQQSQYQSQATTLADVSPMPPPGFNFAYVGKGSTSMTGMMLKVLPADKDATVRQVEKVVRYFLRGDHQPPQPLLPKSAKIEFEKKPIPPFSTVKVTGPNGYDLTFEIPTERSSKFPTAADVARGQDAAIAAFLKRVGDLIDRINSGEVPQR